MVEINNFINCLTRTRRKLIAFSSFCKLCSFKLAKIIKLGLRIFNFLAGALWSCSFNYVLYKVVSYLLCIEQWSFAGLARHNNPKTLCFNWKNNLHIFCWKDWSFELIPCIFKCDSSNILWASDCCLNYGMFMKFRYRAKDFVNTMLISMSKLFSTPFIDSSYEIGLSKYRFIKICIPFILICLEKRWF